MRARRDMPPGLWGCGRNAGQQRRRAAPGRTLPPKLNTQAGHAGSNGYTADLCCRGRNAGKAVGTHCRGFIKSWAGFARPERRAAEMTHSPRMHTSPKVNTQAVHVASEWACHMSCGSPSGTPSSRDDAQPPDAHFPEGEHAGGTCGFRMGMPHELREPGRNTGHQRIHAAPGRTLPPKLNSRRWDTRIRGHTT